MYFPQLRILTINGFVTPAADNQRSDNRKQKPIAKPGIRSKVLSKYVYIYIGSGQIKRAHNHNAVNRQNSFRPSLILPRP